MNNNETTAYLWVEKYRPHKVADCVMPDRMKTIFQGIVDHGQMDNLTLIGPPGTGKTTVARAMCEQMGIDHIVINASRERSIDVIRTSVQTYASSVSFDSDYKVIILDEADGLTLDAQKALRGLIEEFSSNCRFIFTGNYGNKISDAITSRCPTIDFNYTKEEKLHLIVAFAKRAGAILDERDISYNRDHLAEVLKKYFPDFRKTLGVLQRLTRSGTLNIEALSAISDDAIKALASTLKKKEFLPMRKWVVDNLDNDFHQVQRGLYDKMREVVADASIPELVLILSKYDERNSRVMDKEINLVAMLTEIMIEINFK